MPVDIQGNFSRPATPIPVTGQEADAPQVNVPINDIYAGLNLLQFLDGRKPMRGDQNLNGYRMRNAADAEAAQDYVTLAQVQDLLSALSVVPAGIMAPISGTQVPAGWVRANGQSLVRADYPGLWDFAQASGNLAATQEAKTAGQYGPGNGSTTFTLPNLEADGGYFIRPITSGRGIGTIQADMVGPHAHNATFAGNAVPPHTHSVDYSDGVPNGAYIDRTPRARAASGQFGTATGAQMGIQTAGGHTPSGTVTVAPSSGSETRPKNISYPVIIKT